MRHYTIVSETNTEVAKASDYSINSATSLRGMNIVTISKISITNASDNIAYVKLFQDVLIGSDANKHFHLLGGTQANAKVEIPVALKLRVTISTPIIEVDADPDVTTLIPLTKRLLPSKRKLLLSSSSPPDPANTTLPDVKSSTLNVFHFFYLLPLMNDGCDKLSKAAYLKIGTFYACAICTISC